MKFLRKIKKKIIIIAIAVIAIPKKIFSVNYSEDDNAISEILKGAPTDPAYGLPSESVFNSNVRVLWDLIKFLIIPAILLIGLAVYWKKSKSSKKRKIIITLIILLLLLILLYIMINY